MHCMQKKDLKNDHKHYFSQLRASCLVTKFVIIFREGKKNKNGR